LDPKVKYQVKLYTELNDIVVNSAVSNSDRVGVGFLVNYLHELFEVEQNSESMSSNKDLTKEQREQMINLLQSKFQ